MKKKFSFIIIFIVFLGILVTTLLPKKSNNSSLNNDFWAVYYAPSSTSVSYGGKDAILLKFDSDGNFTQEDTKAYPYSGLVNYENSIIFQNPNGLSKLDNTLTNLNINITDDTIGYDMSDILHDKNIFYFLLNECFKDTFYSSKLILGDSNNQYEHQIKGFINAYGNDMDNIYVLTSDMTNRYSKQIQKIAVNSSEDITIQANELTFDSEIDSNSKMIVVNDYIYAFTIKNNNMVTILKISKETLELTDEFNLINFDSSIDGDNYYPISINSIFLNDNKIYYPTIEGKVYSFDVTTNEFLEEFTLENITPSSNAISFYSKSQNELYVYYFNDSLNSYVLDSYNTSGKLLYNIKLDNLKIDNKLYPHSFIKIESNHE